MTRHWSVRAFRALLALYPGEFRDEYGRELALVFADRYRDAATVGERMRVWGEAIGGVLREAPREHVAMLRQDLRYAVRMIGRSPVFAATAILTLALGIGANTAIFQLIDAVQLRLLPIANPQELAEVRIIGGNGGFGVNPGRYSEMTRPLYEELRAHQEAFSDMFAWAAFDFRIGERQASRRVNGIVVSGDFFRVLGIQPWRGRLIEARDEASACPASRVVVSHAYWQRELGGRDLTGDPRLTVNGDRLEIIGVTPPAFTGIAVGETFDIAVSMCREAQPRRDRFDINVMGRLRPGWTIDRATAHLQMLSPGLFDATIPIGYGAESIARYKAFRLGAYPASGGVSALRREYSTSLQLLLAITGLVLLLACANLANLLLARASTRDREVAVRLALGASRIRLLRQFLTECGLIAVLGAALAVILAQVLSRLLVRAIATTDGGGVMLSLPLDWRLLLFTATIASATCLIFGSAPALRASRVEPAEAMRAGGRGLTSSRSRFGTQRALVVMQIAVSLVLLVAALLFVRSFYNLITFDAGMRQEGIAVGLFDFPQRVVKGEQANQFARALLDEIRATPGVVSAGSTTNVPLFGGGWGHGVTVRAVNAPSKFTWVSPGYFETMGIPIVQGRDFTLRDTTSSPRVAIVNQAFVRRFVGVGQPSQTNPIGISLRTSPEPNYPSTVYEIVGVIPDTQYSELRGTVPPMVFAPDSQFPPLAPWAAVMIHSSIDPTSAIATLKQRLTQTHPEMFQEYTVFQTHIREGLLRERLLAMLAGFFGALAGILAMIGLYGMIAFAVAQRRQEIGIRIALGARRTQVIAMVMREAARLLLIGAVAGTAMSLAAGRSTASLLFGVTAYDPLTLSAALLLLTTIAIMASLLPARTAARQDPLVALRSE